MEPSQLQQAVAQRTKYIELLNRIKDSTKSPGMAKRIDREITRIEARANATTRKRDRRQRKAKNKALDT